jgi:hypothetical protein
MVLEKTLDQDQCDHLEANSVNDELGELVSRKQMAQCHGEKAGHEHSHHGPGQQAYYSFKLPRSLRQHSRTVWERTVSDYSKVLNISVANTAHPL